MELSAPCLRSVARVSRCDVARVLLLILPLVTLVSVTGSSRAQATAVRVETFSFNPDGEVRIENPTGSVRVEVWGDQGVRIMAEKKSPAGSLIGPNDLVLMGAGNTIVAQCRQTGQSGRIDITVYLPASAHLRVTGGPWPVDVKGALSSAVIETTAGNISYHLPRSAGARVVMHSARGTVRSTVPLAVTEKTGVRSLQGKQGSGGAPVFLSSQSGSISLAPGSDAPAMAMANAGPQPSAYSQERQPVYRQPSSRQPSAGQSQQRAADESEDRLDEDDDDPGSIARPPAPRRAATRSSSGGWATIAGQDRSDESTTEYKGGPFVRPREERNTSSGGSGLRVRIIPANTPLGVEPEERNSSIYDQADQTYEEKRGATNRQSGQPPNRTGASVPQTGSLPGRDERQASRSPYDYPLDRGAARSREPEDDFPGQIAAARPRPSGPPALRRPGDDAEEPASSVVGSIEESEPGEEAITLKTSLVNLNVSVTNRSGVSLPNLSKEDFVVAENGERQQIQFFAPTESPFNLVLLLDLSGSIKDKLDIIKAGALKFLQVLGPRDRVAVVIFTDQVRVISQLTSDRDLLRKRIKAIEEPVGGTAFYEAMWFSLADTLRGTEGQRNAIVVMTDGVDSSLDRYNPAPTRVTFNRLARRLEESDVIVFPIYLDTEYEEVFERGNGTAEAYAIARTQLDAISDLTGGQVFKAKEVKDLSGVYKQVAASLRTVYSIGYSPTNAEKDGSFRRVRVHVNRPDAAVRTRKGYYAR